MTSSNRKQPKKTSNKQTRNKTKVFEKVNVITVVAGTIIALGALFVSIQSNMIAQQANEIANKEQPPQIKLVEVRVYAADRIRADDPNQRQSACRTYIRFSNISDIETTLLSVQLKVHVQKGIATLVVSDTIPFSRIDDNTGFAAVGRNNDSFSLQQFLEQDTVSDVGLPFSVKAHSTNDVIVDLMLFTKVDKHEVKLLSTYEHPLDLDKPFVYTGKPEELVTVEYSLNFPDAKSTATNLVPCFQLIPK